VVQDILPPRVCYGLCLLNKLDREDRLGEITVTRGASTTLLKRAPIETRRDVFHNRLSVASGENDIVMIGYRVRRVDIVIVALLYPFLTL